MEKRAELVMGGGMREVDVAVHTGLSARINGPGRLDRGLVNHPIAGGYALTYNVDADLWASWLAANKDTDMVRNELIFAQEKLANASAQAKANEPRKTGLEPLNPAGDSRAPKRRLKTQGGALNPLETANVSSTSA
jgi:hypothetical protein